MANRIDRVRHLIMRLNAADDPGPATDFDPISFVPGWCYVRGTSGFLIDTPRKPRPTITHAIWSREHAFSSRAELVAFLRVEWMTDARAWIAQRVAGGEVVPPIPPTHAVVTVAAADVTVTRARWVLLLGQDQPVWHRLPPGAACAHHGVVIDEDSRTRKTPPIGAVICGECLGPPRP